MAWASGRHISRDVHEESKQRLVDARSGVYYTVVRRLALLAFFMHIPAYVPATCPSHTKNRVGVLPMSHKWHNEHDVVRHLPDVWVILEVLLPCLKSCLFPGQAENVTW